MGDMNLSVKEVKLANWLECDFATSTLTVDSCPS